MPKNLDNYQDRIHLDQPEKIIKKYFPDRVLSKCYGDGQLCPCPNCSTGSKETGTQRPF